MPKDINKNVYINNQKEWKEPKIIVLMNLMNCKLN